MVRTAQIALNMVVPLILAACVDSARPTDPMVATNGGSSAVSDDSRADGGSVRSVIMHDNCDPTTFNAAVGPGTCVRSGGIKFDQFIAQLTRHGHVQGYDFSPPAFKVNPGQTIMATNNGGEVHTFTRVAAFGGGIVPLLNQLSGNTVVAPECTQLAPTDFVAPAGSFETSVGGSEAVMFQCCIHPWMRAIANP
jgi:plastocyanin